MEALAAEVRLGDVRDEAVLSRGADLLDEPDGHLEGIVVALMVHLEVHGGANAAASVLHEEEGGVSGGRSERSRGRSIVMDVY